MPQFSIKSMDTPGLTQTLIQNELTFSIPGFQIWHIYSANPFILW